MRGFPQKALSDMRVLLIWEGNPSVHLLGGFGEPTKSLVIIFPSHFRRSIYRPRLGRDEFRGPGPITPQRAPSVPLR